MALRYGEGGGGGGGGGSREGDDDGDVLRRDEDSLTVTIDACNRSLFPIIGMASWASRPVDGCLSLYMVELNQFTVPIYGYVSPLLVLLTIVTNCLVCLVLFRRNMRSPTNAILVAMAMSDTLTGTLPIPCFVYFYALDRHDVYVPYRWCFAYHCLTDYLPTIFHTASIWLTVVLAAQRYVYVRHSAVGKRLCTISNVVKVIAAVYVLAGASQLCRFAEYRYVPVEVGSDRRACFYDFSPLIERHQHLYFNLYYWFRVVFIHFVPCASLVLLNSALVLTMRSAQRRRQALLHETAAGAAGAAAACDCTATAGRLIENKSGTLMLVTVVGVSLLVELPLACLLIVVVTENTFEVELLNQQTTYSASLFLNMLTLITYPLNFFIYCAMSERFRRAFCALFVKDSSPPAPPPLPPPSPPPPPLHRENCADDEKPSPTAAPDVRVLATDSAGDTAL